MFGLPEKLSHWFFSMQNNYPALDMFPARDMFASLHFEGNFRPAEGDMRWYYATGKTYTVCRLCLIHTACMLVNMDDLLVNMLRRGKAMI